MASPGSEQRALKHYISSQLQAQVATIVQGTRWSSAAVFAQRPKFQKLGSTVLLAVGNVRRKTLRVGMGRPAGLKRHEYEVELLIEANDHDDQGGGDDFDQLVDQVDLVLETIPLRAVIPDPGSTQTYAVSKIGEEIESHTLDPIQTAPQNLVTFTATKQFTVWTSYND